MKATKILAFVCVFLFIVLCLLHYFSQRPLWGDEQFILNNLESLSGFEIFGPLKDSQAFPRVYLRGVQFLSKLFNYSVLSLRFLPLLCSIVAFFIWKKLYKQVLSGPWLRLLALFSLGGSYYFSYYAAELKHYSMDVLVVAIFCLYLGYQRKLTASKPSKMFMAATLFLPLTLFFSYTAFLLFWVVSYNFLFLIVRNKKLAPLAIIYTVSSALAAVSVYFIDLRYNFATVGLFSYWNDYFVCIDSVYCFFKSFSEGLRKLATWWFGNIDFLKRGASFVIPFFAISMFTYGFKAIRENKYRIWSLDAVGLVIFLELLILGVFKKYPFTGERITLFFAPLVFYFIIKGISSLQRVKILYRFFIISYIVLILGSGLNSFLSYLKLYL